MSEGGQRPGGLTVLAVVNFIVGGFGMLGSIGSIVVRAFGPRLREQSERERPDRSRNGELQAMLDVDGTLFTAVHGVGALAALLAFIAAIGYLKQRRFLGRRLGTAYAVLAICAAVAAVVWIPDRAGGGFSPATMIAIGYPLLTLIMINGTFREDFIRP